MWLKIPCDSAEENDLNFEKKLSTVKETANAKEEKINPTHALPIQFQRLKHAIQLTRPIRKLWAEALYFPQSQFNNDVMRIQKCINECKSEMNSYAEVFNTICGRSWNLISEEWIVAALFYQPQSYAMFRSEKLLTKHLMNNNYLMKQQINGNKSQLLIKTLFNQKFLIVSDENSNVTLDDVEDDINLICPPCVVDICHNDILLQNVPIQDFRWPTQEHLLGENAQFLCNRDDNNQRIKTLGELRRKVITNRTASILIRSIFSAYSQRPCYGTENLNGAFHWKTYQQVYEHMKRLPGALLSRGIKPGSFIGFCTESSSSALELYFGLIMGNYTTVPLSNHLTNEHAMHIIKESNVQAIFLSKKMSKRWKTIIDSVNKDTSSSTIIQQFVCLDDDDDLFHHWLQITRAQWCIGLNENNDTDNEKKEETANTVKDDQYQKFIGMYCVGTIIRNTKNSINETCNIVLRISKNQILNKGWGDGVMETNGRIAINNEIFDVTINWPSSPSSMNITVWESEDNADGDDNYNGNSGGGIFSVIKNIFIKKKERKWRMKMISSTNQDNDVHHKNEWSGSLILNNGKTKQTPVTGTFHFQRVIQDIKNVETKADTDNNNNNNYKSKDTLRQPTNQSAFCPNGHISYKYNVSSILPICCDICDAHLRKGTVTECCLICDFDSCITCEKIRRGINTIQDELCSLQLPINDHYDIEEHRVSRSPRLILYTSGSTGMPKGTIISDRTFRKRAGRKCRNTIDMDKYVHSSVALLRSSLAVSSTPYNLLSTLANGGRIAIITPVTRVFEIAPIINPTGMGGVPQSWNVLYKRYHEEKDILLLKNRERGGDKEEEEIMKKLNRKYRQCLGKRIQMLNCGGATPIPEVQLWLKKIFSHVTITENYGATETGNITSSGRASYSASSSNNDCVMSDGVQVRLEDWGEYKSTDKPYPRGEIIVKTNFIADGYLNRPDLTEKAFTEDGFYRTGDIGELYDNRRIKVIDRKKNVFKMLCGEWVSPENVEACYTGHCKDVYQIFIHGNSSHSHVVAIVVVKSKNISNDTQEMKSDTNDNKDDFNDDFNDDFKNIILKQMEDTKNLCHLRHFELPLAIHIIDNRFTMDNKMLTKTGKICRPAIRTKYSKILENLLLITSKLQNGAHKSKAGPSTTHTFSLCDVLEEGLLSLHMDNINNGDNGDDNYGISKELNAKWNKLRFGDSISCM